MPQGDSPLGEVLNKMNKQKSQLVKCTVSSSTILTVEDLNRTNHEWMKWSTEPKRRN